MNGSPCHFSTVPLSPSSTFKYSCSPLFPFFAFPPFFFVLIYFLHLLSFLSLPYSFPPPSLLSFSLINFLHLLSFFSLPYSFSPPIYSFFPLFASSRPRQTAPPPPTASSRRQTGDARLPRISSPRHYAKTHVGWKNCL